MVCSFRYRPVGDNYRQGHAAELTVLEEIKKLLPKAETAKQIRLYVEGGPRYMVGDIVLQPERDVAHRS